MIAVAMPCREKGSRAEARTKEIERCLKMNPQYIFMMDDDQLLPSDACLTLMVTAMREFPDMTKDPTRINDIVIIDASNKDASDSNVYYHPDGELAYCTISCCLIKANVFEKLPQPWFSTAYEYREIETKNGKRQWQVQEKYNDDNRGEDVYFTRKCIENGINIAVLEGYKSPHYNLEAL